MNANNISGCNTALPYGARVRSTGIVVAIGRNPDSATTGNIVVCSAALRGVSPRQTSSSKRKISPILVEYVMPQDDAGMQTGNMACGDIVEGVGAIRNVCDEYLMVDPVAELKITRRGEEQYEKAYARLTGAQRFAIRTFAAECIRHNRYLLKYYEILKDMDSFHFFSCLFTGKSLASLAYIEAEGMLLSEDATRGKGKRQIWLLASAFSRHKYPPILVSCKASGVHGHAYDCVFSLRIPLFSTSPHWSRARGDTLPVGFIGGSARATRTSMSASSKIAFFHALSNMLCAPKAISIMIFGNGSKALRLSSLLVKWGGELGNIEELHACVHGWWGDGYWDLPFKIHKTEKLPIKVVFTNYPDGALNRIMIVAEGNGDFLDTANERSCAVTLNDDPPEFFEGKYRPSAKEWRYICKWIELNRELLCDREYFDDYRAIRYVTECPSCRMS